MIRAGLLIALLLLPTGARAQFLSCIDQTQSWSNGFSAGSIAAVTYIVSLPIGTRAPMIRPPASSLGWLIAAYTGAPRAEILVVIPSNTAKQFQSLTNADSQFSTLKARSHELLLLEGTYCPLLAEDQPFANSGAPIWSK